MAQMAAHLVEQVIPWVPTRQWVVSVPVPLRYWMAGVWPKYPNALLYHRLPTRHEPRRLLNFIT
jgi:hypothetical protein